MAADPDGFLVALTEVYRSRPCQVLPNALWKTALQLDLDDYVWEIERDATGVLRLWARSDRCLAAYWSRDRDDGMPDSLPAGVSLALVHGHYATEAVLGRFTRHAAYFRLSRELGSLPLSGPPDGYGFVPVVPKDDAEAIAELIGHCYETLHPSAGDVRSWGQHATYRSNLWVGMMNLASGELAGLGIAELDDRACEGALEWIQVLPEHRGRGLGRAVVFELLRRMVGAVDLVTVSGVAGGPDSPEEFYRRCGFTGDDVWWVLRQQGD